MGFVGALISARVRRNRRLARVRQRLQLQLHRRHATPGATCWASSAASGRHGGGSTTRGSAAISATASAPSPSATICPSRPTASRSRRMLTDADGLAAPHIEYQPHENDRRMMRFALDRLKDLATAVDAFDYRLHDYLSPEGVYQTPAWHLLGTCRMGSRPEDFGHQPLAPVMGRAEPLHRRRQRSGDWRRRQSHRHHLRAGTARRRAPARQFSSVA